MSGKRACCLWKSSSCIYSKHDSGCSGFVIAIRNPCAGSSMTKCTFGKYCCATMKTARRSDFRPSEARMHTFFKQSERSFVLQLTRSFKASFLFGFALAFAGNAAPLAGNAPPLAGIAPPLAGIAAALANIAIPPMRIRRFNMRLQRRVKCLQFMFKETSAVHRVIIFQLAR